MDTWNNPERYDELQVAFFDGLMAAIVVQCQPPNGRKKVLKYSFRAIAVD